MSRRVRRYRAAACVAAAFLGGCTTSGVVRDATPLPAGATHVFVAADIADCRFHAPALSPAAQTAVLVPDGATVLAPGNHDIVAGSYAAVRDYFPQAARAADDDFFAYAVQPATGWWLVVVDSNVSGERMHRQRAWLERTLAGIRADPSSAAACLAVMWHAPVYSSGWHKGSGEHMRPAWALVDRYRADLVLSGHEHFYERFDPLDASGRAPRDGQAPRQFVVGTGGARLYGFWRPPYRSEARVLEHGVLQLSLAAGSYGWRFIAIDGSVRDAGSARCRAGVNSGNVPLDRAASIAR